MAESMEDRVFLLKRLHDTLANPETSTKRRAEAASAAMEAEAYMLENLAELRAARERLLAEETLESLMGAGYVDMLLSSFDNARTITATALHKATNR